MSTLGMSFGLFMSGYILKVVRAGMEGEWKETLTAGVPYIFGMYAIVGLIKTILTMFLTERSTLR